MTTSDEERHQFGAALDAALDGRSHAWLGAEVARLLGLPSPITQSAVSQWVAGKTAPTPDKVFAIEQVLGRKPGTLSRLLGFLPVDARAMVSVLDALEADTSISDEMRKALRAAYLAAAR